MMNYFLGLIWILILLLAYVLFEKVCNYGFSKTAIETIVIWWKNGSGKWIVIISGICLITQAFIAQDIVTKVYALLFGKTEQYTLIGKGLNNELYYIDDNGKVEEVVSDIYDQRHFFADSFIDVNKPDTVLRYGKKTTAVFRAGALRLGNFFLGYTFLFICILFVGLGFLVILGVNAKIAAPDMFTGETDFLTGWKWLLHYFKNGVFISLGLLFLLAAGTLIVTKQRHKIKFEVVSGSNEKQLPEAITKGSEIEGVVLLSLNHIMTSNYTGEKTVTSKRRVYRNYLVEFTDVYENPVRLRFTVFKDKHSKDWIAATSDLKKKKMKFVIADDMTIWPKALFDKGITPGSN